MKHTKEKGRAPPKGRRRLEFGAPKQQLPLLNKAVYMDIKNSRQADLMEEQLKKLGARVEKFLSVEVNYVISSSGPSKPDEKLGREENPQSPSFVASPFSCVPSPAAQPDTKTVAVSRGKALAQIACAKNKASSVVTSAEKLGIKVISAEAATKWLEKELRKMKCSTASNIKENKSKKVDVKLKESKTKSKPLSGSFIKFEDNSRHYRPVKVEFDGWPRLNLTAPPGICPFGEAKVKVQNLYGARNRVHESSHVVGCGAVPAAPRHAAPNPVEEEVRSVEKPANKPELVGVPIAPIGDAKRFVNFQFKKSLAINKQQGFCDCCGVKFQNLDEHVRGEQHRAFTRHKGNYESLDALISQIPSTVDFLQSVLLKHCVQRREEPTVSSCVPAQYINLVPPISPLTTDKIHAPSLETAATCLKTPDPSGQDIAAFKEHLTATDADLISRRETVTPTKQEPTVDSRPQAVVIRRPMPSGIFTSPRRRPITPSKKPWMQERSMVFSDSPIGSLQPSLCTSKETLPNFLTDNTVNSLKRLANVCDKSNARRPNHSSEGAKVSKNLFSIILNQRFAKLGKKSGTAQLDKKVTDLCQTKIVAVEPEKALKHCDLEVNVEREICGHSHNENMPNVEDKAAESCDLKKFNSVEKQTEIEHDQIRENLMINKESEANGSCHEKIMATKRKLEVNYIHSGECITSKKEIIVSHNINTLVDEEKQMEDSENRNVPVEEEMKRAVSIHEKYVNGEETMELIDWNQEIEMTAKYEPEKICSSRHTGLSFEHKMKCTAVVHQKIMTVEQEKEVTDCNLEKDMTATQEIEKLESRHIASMSVDQGAEVNGCSEFVAIKHDIEMTGSSHDRAVTGEKNMEITGSGHDRADIGEKNMEKTGAGHDRADIGEKNMEKTGSSHDRADIGEKNMEKSGSGHDRADIGEKNMEKTGSSLDRADIGEKNMEKTGSSHERADIGEKNMEKTGSIHDRADVGEKNMEKTGSGHDRADIGEKNIEKTTSGHEIVMTVEQGNIVVGLQHDEIGIVEQEEMEVTKTNHDNDITFEQEENVMEFNHVNGITIEEQEVIRFNQEETIIEQEKELIGLNPDNSITVDQGKEVTGPSHDDNITVEQEKEVVMLNPDKSITIEQEMEVMLLDPDNSITVEQEKEVMLLDPDNSITVEQEKEVMLLDPDNSITVEQEKEVMLLNPDNSITVEQEKEVMLNPDESITIEQEMEVTEPSHDNSITVEQEKEVMLLNPDKSITIEQEKEVTEPSHDNSITVEQEKEVMLLNPDNSITVEQEKEVMLNPDESITIEQEMEVTGPSHDNNNIVEEEKEVMLNPDKSITIEQEIEVTEPGHDNSYTSEQQKEGKFCYNDKIMTVGNKLTETEIHCRKSLAAKKKEINVFNCEKSIAVEYTMKNKDPCHKESVNFEEEKTKGNSSHENCTTSVNKGENTTNDTKYDESIAFDQAYSNDKNITFEQETEKISSKQDRKSTNLVFENKDIDFTHVKGRTYEEEIKEKSFSQEKMMAVEEKDKTFSNQEQLWDIQQEMAESSLNHEQIETVKEKRETSSKDEQIEDVEVEMAASSLNHEQIVTVEEKRETSSKDEQIEDVEVEMAANSLNHEKIVTVEEKKEPSSKDEQKENVEVEMEESSSNHEQQISAFEQEKDTVGSNQNKNLFVKQKEVNSSHEKRKVVGQENETNFSLGHSMLIENVITVKGFHNDENMSRHDKCEAVERKEKEGSGLKKRLTDEQGNKSKVSGHEKNIAVEEKEKKVYSHDEKSVSRRKKRRSHHENNSGFEEKEMAGPTYTEHMSVEKRNERKRSSHENNTSFKEKEMTGKEHMTVEKRKERRSNHVETEEKKCNIDSKHKECLTVENNEANDRGKILIDDQRNKMKGTFNEKILPVDEKKKIEVFYCVKVNSGERGKDKKSYNHEQHFAGEEKSSKHCKYDEHKTVKNKKEKESSHHEKLLNEEQRSQKKGSNNEDDKSIERRRERRNSSHRKSTSAEVKEIKDSRCKDDVTLEKRDMKRSGHENYASAEEVKSGVKSKHDECLTAEYKKENESSTCEKRLSHEPRNRNKDSGHEKYKAAEEKKKTKVSNHKEDKSVERKQTRTSSNHEKRLSVERKEMTDFNYKEGLSLEDAERKSSNHVKYKAAEERKNSKDSRHDKSIAVENRKEKNSSLHEKGLTDEQRSQQKGSNHEDDVTTDKGMDRKRSNHEKDMTTDKGMDRKRSNHEEDMTTDKGKDRKRSNHEKHVSADKKKDRKRSNHEKHAPAGEKKSHMETKQDAKHEVVGYKNEDSFDHGKRGNDEPRNRVKDSSHEKNIDVEETKKTKVSYCKEDKSVERSKERKSYNQEKHFATEDKKSNDEHIAVEIKEKKNSRHEKGLNDEQRGQQKDSKHDEDKSVEKRNERKSSSDEKSASLEEKEMKHSNAKENMPVEKRNERKSSNHEKNASLEEKEIKHSNAKENMPVEKRNERKSSNHEKRASLEVKKMKHSNSKEDMVVEKRNERKSSNHEKSASLEKKETKHSPSKEDMAVEKRKDGRRCSYEKHLNSKHGESMTVEYKKEKKSSHLDKSSTDEQRNRKKSSSLEKYIAVEERQKAKVSNHDKEKSVEKKQESEISNNERSLSIEEMKMTGSDCNEGKPIEKMKRSNHGKHSATEEKKRNEELMAADYKKEIKNSHHEKELVGEQRIQQKCYNQEEDKRKTRKRSNCEKHGVVEATKNHLNTKHDECMSVDYKKKMQKSDHEKRLLDESRDRNKSSCHEKHRSTEENKKPKVSNHEKDKSFERHKKRKLSKQDEHLSVEGKRIARSSCEEDKVVERKGRKSSDHDSKTDVEEKRNKISESGECVAVENNVQKNSDHKKSSSVQQEKNIQDCDKKSLVSGRKTPQVNMNPVVRISGKELRQCIVSDSLAETVYKHLSGSGMGAKACNLIYVASHKDNINNLLLNHGQARQGTVSCSASSANQNLLQSKNRQSSYESEDKSGNKEPGSKICKDDDGSKICKDGDGSKICKDRGTVCFEKSVKSNMDSRCRHRNETITTHVEICEETDKATCDNSQGCPSKICRESLQEKLGTCSGKPASDLGGDLQEALEKRGKDFEAKKVCNVEKCVKTDRLFELQGDGQVIREVDVVDPLLSSVEFENPNMKQSAEVGSVSMSDNLHEVVYNSKDSYMDEDTVDTDFYEIHKGGRQNKIVNMEEMNNVHTSFPYITERALLPHSTTQPSPSFCMTEPIPQLLAIDTKSFPHLPEPIHQLLSTDPESFPHTLEPTTLPTTTQSSSLPHTTKSVKTENADKAFRAKNVDCKLTEDQSIHRQSSTASSDKLERDKIEYIQNSSYKNFQTCTGTQKKQIYSECRLELDFQQGNIRKENCVDDNISADREPVDQVLEGKSIQENAERMNVALDEISASTTISCVVGEQSKHHSRGGGPVNDYDTDSLLSSENMKTAMRNSDEGSDFMELVDWTENVVVPNIADRVKSRSRVVACVAPAVGQEGVQGSDEEKKAWRRRKKASRERNKKHSVDGINSQRISDRSGRLAARNVLSHSGEKHHSDRSGRLAARNVLSHSGEKHHKKTRKQKSNPDVIVPNIAESVKQRRSCTLFNHLGQYANSGEGTDADEENMKVMSRSTQKLRQRRYYSARERNVKAHSLKSGAEYDKNGLVRQSRILSCQRRSNDAKVDSSVDMTSEMETDGKTSTLSGGLSKADDDAGDLSSAIVVRRKKSHVYPGNKRPEVDWGKVQPADGSFEQDPVENNSWREVGLVAENETCVQSNILIASHQSWSHSIAGSQAKSQRMREAKIILVDIKTSPQANVHTKVSSSDHHSDIHTGTRSSFHYNIEAQTSSSSCHANIHTHSPTIHYQTNINIKPSTSPAQTNNEDILTHRSRYRTVGQMETGGHTPCSKCPQFARSISDVPSSPGLSCSPRLRLKIRRRSGNKGFSSILEEIHDCLPANIAGCSAHADMEHCGDSCECRNKVEEKYSSRIHHNYPADPLTQHYMGSNSSSDMPTIPQAQYEGLLQRMPDVMNPCKRKREPCAPHSSDSESTLEYPLSFETVNKRIKLSPGHCTHPDIDDNNYADYQFEHNEVPPGVTACISSVNTAASINHNNRPHSSNRHRISSPCFSSPVTKRHFRCFSTPKKSEAPDKSAAGIESPVFNLSMKQLRHMHSVHSNTAALSHMHSVHSNAAALSLPGESAPQMGISCQALKNAGLEANIMLDTSLALKQAAERHLSVKRLLSPPGLDFPSAKRTKVDNSLCLAADRNSVQLECKQEAVPLDNLAESSNHGFRSLVQEAPNCNPTSEVKHPVNHLLPSYPASTSQHALTSGRPSAGVSQLDLRSFDSTPLVTCTAGKNTKQANSNCSADDTVLLLDIDTFSGVSDLGFEDLLNQVHTFSSPDKATDTSWGDICDTYLSTSFNNHNIQTLGQPVLGKSPAGAEARAVSFSPCRKQFKNFNSPFRIRTADESVKRQTVSGRQEHIHQQKTTTGPGSPRERTVLKTEANYSGLVAATVQQELQTPVKNADIEDLNLSPYIQQVDDVISFNFMSPQRVKTNPHETHSSSKKIPVSPQVGHRRSCTAPHSRCLFSPAKSPQKVSCSPHQTHRSTTQSLLSSQAKHQTHIPTTQSLLSPQAEHQRSCSVSHSKCVFSPAKRSPQKINCSSHQTHRPTTQCLMGSHSEHQRSHNVFNPKRLFSPATSSPQGINYRPHHTHKSAIQPQLRSQPEHHRSHKASHSKCLFSPASAADHVS